MERKMITSLEAIQLTIVNNQTVLLRVPKELYPKEAVTSAVYKFTDRCYVTIEVLNSTHYAVQLKLKIIGADIHILAEDFYNELIDQEIRFRLDNSNRNIKELILKKAFSPIQTDEEDK